MIVVAVYGASIFGYDKYKYSTNQVADRIIEANKERKKRNMLFWSPPSNGDWRALAALKLNKRPVKINLDEVNTHHLMQYIREVNSALFHMSGNCQLLSDVLMYNLLNQDGYFLSARNTFPVFQGVNTIDDYLLGQYLEPYSFFGEQISDSISDDNPIYSNSIDQLEKRILACHHETNEKIFQIHATGYVIPFWGAGGHVFNAIILKNEQNEPVVQFIDAWSKSNPLPAKNQLNQKYSGSGAEFSFEYCRDKNLIHQFSFEEVIGENAKKSP